MLGTLCCRHHRRADGLCALGRWAVLVEDVTMADNREEMLTVLREQRRRQGGKIRGLMTLECPASSCPVGEITIRVHERAGGTLLQPKLKCCRCGQEVWFVGLE